MGYGRIGEKQTLTGARRLHNQRCRNVQTTVRVDSVQPHAGSKSFPAGPVCGGRNAFAMQEVASGKATSLCDVAPKIGAADRKYLFVAQLLNFYSWIVVESSRTRASM